MNILTHFLCYAAGAVSGVVLMCLLITVKQEDERLSQMKWRDEQ